MSKAKVLVVDDEPDVVTMIQRALEAEGFEAISAFDGISAVDIADEESPDLIVLDIMMPMMSGYEVCEQLRMNPRTKDTPIICVTSAHAGEVVDRCRKAGATILIMKPFSPMELVAQIKRLISVDD